LTYHCSSSGGKQSPIEPTRHISPDRELVPIDDKPYNDFDASSRWQISGFSQISANTEIPHFSRATTKKLL